MRRHRSFAAALSLMVFASTAAAGQGVGSLVDEGTFLVSKSGSPAGTESFKIVRLDDGNLMATGRYTAGSSHVTSSLRTDSVGTPIKYQLNVNDGRASVLRVAALASGTRLSARSTDQRGDESMREYPVPSGRCLILDDDLVHQLYFVALGKRTGAVQVIDTRASRGGTRTLAAHGLEPVDVAGHSVTATHYTLSGGGAQREFWIDAAGRLLRVEIPALGLKAAREELPR
jgi:hypothetical protein